MKIELKVRKALRMYNEYRFIDRDAHVIEPHDMFRKYLESKFCAQMPEVWVDYQSEPPGFGFKVAIPTSSGAAVCSDSFSTRASRIPAFAIASTMGRLVL